MSNKVEENIIVSSPKLAITENQNEKISVEIGKFEPSELVVDNTEWSLSGKLNLKINFPPLLKSDLLNEPFIINLEQFRSYDFDKVEDLINSVYEISKEKIINSWKKGMEIVVICDGKIIIESKNIEDASKEIVNDLKEKLNRPCYVFTAPSYSEEIRWKYVPSDNYYPNLPLYVGEEEISDDEICQTQVLLPDFDTGNPVYKIFNFDLFPDSVRDINPEDSIGSEHMGKTYRYYPKELKICIKDSKNTVRSRVYRLQLVRNWQKSAIVQCSPNRIGFVGRDICQDQNVQLLLDFNQRKTRIIRIN